MVDDMEEEVVDKSLRWTKASSLCRCTPHTQCPQSLGTPADKSARSLWICFWWFDKIYTWRKSISDRPVNAILECFFSGTAKLHLNISLWDEDKRILLVGCFVVLYGWLVGFGWLFGRVLDVGKLEGCETILRTSSLWRGPLLYRRICQRWKVKVCVLYRNKAGVCVVLCVIL